MPSELLHCHYLIAYSFIRPPLSNPGCGPKKITPSGLSIRPRSSAGREIKSAAVPLPRVSMAETCIPALFLVPNKLYIYGLRHTADRVGTVKPFILSDKSSKGRQRQRDAADHGNLIIPSILFSYLLQLATSTAAAVCEPVLLVQRKFGGMLKRFSQARAPREDKESSSKKATPQHNATRR